MAIVREHPYIDENGAAHADLEKHYSDAGKMLIQVETGNEYEQAVDIYPCKYNYIEKPDEKLLEDGDEEHANNTANYS